MIPSSSGASIPVAARASSSSARVARISASVATIGSIALTGCSAATRRIARSWVARTSGRWSARRIPRTPRKGLASAGIGSAGSGLSAPASSVRTTSGRPSSATAISRRVSACSSSSGSCRDRGRGTRCAAGPRPRPRAPRPSPPRRPSRGWRRPPPARRRARARLVRALERGAPRRRGALAALLRRGQLGGRRVDLQRAGVAVEQQRRALCDRQQASPSPTAAGRPSARERMAACAVTEPWAVAIPRTSLGSSPAASAGVSSPASTIPGSSGAAAALR